MEGLTSKQRANKLVKVGLIPAGELEEAEGYRLSGPQKVQGVRSHPAQHWIWIQQEDSPHASKR
jgi:hypothetical protein